jgi:hypothetical protein
VLGYHVAVPQAGLYLSIHTINASLNDRIRDQMPSAISLQRFSLFAFRSSCSLSVCDKGRTQRPLFSEKRTAKSE